MCVCVHMRPFSLCRRGLRSRKSSTCFALEGILSLTSLFISGSFFLSVTHLLFFSSLSSPFPSFSSCNEVIQARGSAKRVTKTAFIATHNRKHTHTLTQHVLSKQCSLAESGGVIWVGVKGQHRKCQGFGEQEQPYSEEKTFPDLAAGGVGLNLSCSLVHVSVAVWMYNPGQGK